MMVSWGLEFSRSFSSIFWGLQGTETLVWGLDGVQDLLFYLFASLPFTVSQVARDYLAIVSFFRHTFFRVIVASICGLPLIVVLVWQGLGLFSTSFTGVGDIWVGLRV